MTMTSMAERRASVLRDIADHTQVLLGEFGMAADGAEQIAAAIADYLAEHWGGQVVSFPKDVAYRLTKRDQEILEASARLGVAALARQFGLGERAVRRLLKRARARSHVDNQLQLPLAAD